MSGAAVGGGATNSGRGAGVGAPGRVTIRLSTASAIRSTGGTGSPAKPGRASIAAVETIRSHIIMNTCWRHGAAGLRLNLVSSWVLPEDNSPEAAYRLQSVGGNVSESNRSAALTPLDSFEDCAHHRMRYAPGFSVSAAPSRGESAWNRPATRILRPIGLRSIPLDVLTPRGLAVLL